MASLEALLVQMLAPVLKKVAVHLLSPVFSAVLGSVQAASVHVVSGMLFSPLLDEGELQPARVALKKKRFWVLGCILVDYSLGAQL